MFGAFLNRMIGRAKVKEDRQKELDKRRALSKYAICGSDEYKMHEEAYDKEDYQRARGLLNHRDNPYGQ